MNHARFINSGFKNLCKLNKYEQKTNVMKPGKWKHEEYHFMWTDIKIYASFSVGYSDF